MSESAMSLQLIASMLVHNGLARRPLAQLRRAKDGSRVFRR